LGSLAVFLSPTSSLQGGLDLSSPLGNFGSDGVYLVLHRRDGRLNARRIPIVEEFHLVADEDSDVRTDHTLRLWTIPRYACTTA